MMELLRSALLDKREKASGLNSTVTVTSTLWPMRPAPMKKPIQPSELSETLLNSCTSTHVISSTDQNEEIQSLRTELSKLREELRSCKFRAEQKTQSLIANNVKLSFKLQKYELETKMQNVKPIQSEKFSAEIQRLQEINRKLELEKSNECATILSRKTQELSEQREKFCCEVNANKLELTKLSKRNEELTTEISKKIAEFNNLELKHEEFKKLFNDLNSRCDELNLKNKSLEMTLSKNSKEDLEIHKNCDTQIKDLTNNINCMAKTVGKLEVEMALEKQTSADLEQQNLLLAEEKAQLETILEVTNETAEEVRIGFEKKLRKFEKRKVEEVRKLNEKRNFELKEFVEEINAMRDQLKELMNSKYQLQTSRRKRRRTKQVTDYVKAHNRKIKTPNLNQTLNDGGREEQKFVLSDKIPSIETVTLSDSED
ncbi:unnamed protein product [Orchesella dallaii]|uniref:Uncharacterized protein n=1 Tax=Orchesella dallaii TaxID=48710 RepID=A0ABP1RZR7_9HEXA